MVKILSGLFILLALPVHAGPFSEVVRKAQFKDCVERSFCSFVTDAVEAGESIQRKSVYSDVVDVCRSKHPTNTYTRYLADDFNIRIMRFSFDGVENFKSCPYPAEAPPCCNDPNSPFEPIAKLVDPFLEEANRNCNLIDFVYDPAFQSCDKCPEGQIFIKTEVQGARYFKIGGAPGRCQTCKDAYGPEFHLDYQFGKRCVQDNGCEAGEHESSRHRFSDGTEHVSCAPNDCPPGYAPNKESDVCESIDQKKECDRCLKKIKKAKKFNFGISRMIKELPGCTKEQLKQITEEVREATVNTLQSEYGTCMEGEYDVAIGGFVACENVHVAHDMIAGLRCEELILADPYKFSEPVYKSLKFPDIPELQGR